MLRLQVDATSPFHSNPSFHLSIPDRGEKVKSSIDFRTESSPAFTFSPRLLPCPAQAVPSMTDGLSSKHPLCCRAKLHTCTSAHRQMLVVKLPRNKHPHVNPMESFDLGGRYHHPQILRFIFPTGKKVNRKI